VALAAGAEERPGRHDDAEVVEHPHREALGVLAGHAQPQEEARVAARGLEAGGEQGREQDVALGGVPRAGLDHVLLVAPRRDRRALDELLGHGPDVRAIALERGDQLRVAGGEPEPVAGHRRALGERVERDDVGAVGDLQRAGRGVAREPQLGVRLVAGQDEAVRAGQGGGALVEGERGGDGRRVVRRVEPEDRDAVPVDRVEVGQPAVPWREAQLGHLGGAGEHRATGRHRVARGGDRDPRARAADDLRQAEDRLLGAERRDDLRVRVEAGAEAALDPPGDDLAQLGQARGLRVAEHGRGLDGLGERAADEGGRLLARLARAEVDHVDAAGERGLLGLVEADERVGRQAGEDRAQPHAKRSSVS
jgi:hypothetical protein